MFMRCSNTHLIPGNLWCLNEQLGSFIGILILQTDAYLDMSQKLKLDLFKGQLLMPTKWRKQKQQQIASIRQWMLCQEQVRAEVESS